MKGRTVRVEKVGGPVDSHGLEVLLRCFPVSLKVLL